MMCQSILFMRFAIYLMTVSLFGVLTTSAVEFDVDPIMQFAEGQLTKTYNHLSSSSMYPIYTESDGHWYERDSAHWGSGFFPGSMWLMYEYTGDNVWQTRAAASQADIAGQATRTDTHDLGFMINDSFGQGYRLTSNTSYKNVVMTASTSLASRFDPDVGMIRSWDWAHNGAFTVIIDNMMNLEMLFWASKNGGQSQWYDYALSHALQTAQDHVRPDGSTYHCIDYNSSNGNIIEHWSHQGYSTNSTWARGQAWAVNGFATTYRETGNEDILDTALLVADWYIDHLPDDYVPYWDFFAPDIPNDERDTSAAAIAASGLLELSTLLDDQAQAMYYYNKAERILNSLTSPAYLSDGSDDAILLHGMYQHRNSGGFDEALTWGEYYMIEALIRYDTYDAPCIKGDVNCDNYVDLVDLVTVGENYNMDDKLHSEGDLNNDGTVDLLDLVILGENYNQQVVSPEPGSVLMMISCGMLALRRRRK